MIKHRPVKTAIFCLAIVTLLGSVNTCKIASGQDLVEQIERNGPSLELFKAQAIDTDVETWKWKVRLSERQQELIAKEQARWQGKLGQTAAQATQLRKALGDAGINYPVQSETLESLDAQINNLKAEITARSYQLQELTITTEAMLKENEFELKTAQLERSLLRERANLLQRELAQLTKLEKEGVTTKASLAQVKSQQIESEMLLVQNTQELKMLTEKSKDTNSTSLELVSKQLRQAKIDLEKLAKKKATIMEQDAMTKSKRLEMETAFLIAMIEKAQTERFELRLENSRYEALIELAAELRAEHEEKLKKGETDNENSDQDD